MNYSMIKSLILKDWYFQRRAILLCLAGGVLSLAIIAFGGKPGFYVGLVFLITIMILIGATLVMGTLVGERENQTLAFVMSLPHLFS
jgi:ABC-2 type transport system permease protein